jgi:hypothetical protein
MLVPQKEGLALDDRMGRTSAMRVLLPWPALALYPLELLTAAIFEFLLVLLNDQGYAG